MSAAPRTVHVVDDDAAVRNSLSLLLDLHGYATHAYASADEFLERCTAACSGCVLVDLRMPGKSELELQAALLARGIELPLVMITAHGDVAAARTSLKSGAVDFLEKPLDTTQLLAAVNAALQKEAGRLEQAGEERPSPRCSSVSLRASAKCSSTCSPAATIVKSPRRWA